eukprot:scaffold1446_cov191-Alexandrium_tamarense.AAC.10
MAAPRDVAQDDPPTTTSTSVHATPPPTYIPTKVEDDALYATTGFRFFPALERGFPYPWCAKRFFGRNSRWVVCEKPPVLRGTTVPDGGAIPKTVELHGWQEATDLLYARKELERRTKDIEEREKSGRHFLPNVNLPAGISSTSSPQVLIAWWRTTSAAMALKKETEEMSIKKRKESWLEKSLVIHRHEQQPTEECEPVNDSLKLLNQDSKNIKTLDDSLIPPARVIAVVPPRKRVYKAPIVYDTLGNEKTKTEGSESNSIILGEDPDLDRMIASIVQECTGRDSNISFDESAIEALKECAKDMAAQGLGFSGIQSVERLKSTERVENAVHVTSADTFASTAQATHIDTKANTTTATADEEDDPHITKMIEDLIREMGDDYQFDDAAMLALKEAAKEIVTNDLDDDDNGNTVLGAICSPRKKAPKKESNGKTSRPNNNVKCDPRDISEDYNQFEKVPGIHIDPEYPYFPDDDEIGNINEMVDSLVQIVTSETGVAFEESAIIALRAAAKVEIYRSWSETPTD